LRGALATKQSSLPLWPLDCSHGDVASQVGARTFWFDRGTPLRPDHSALKMARADQVKAGPAGAAAQRLGLDVIEHAIRLWPSGLRVCRRYIAIKLPFVAIQGSSRVRRSGRLATRSNSHSVVARSDWHHDSACGGRLERTRPFFAAAFEAMQSIGSSTRIVEADQASADWLWWLFRQRRLTSSPCRCGAF
jgi:hypothetical protein